MRIEDYPATCLHCGRVFPTTHERLMGVCVDCIQASKLKAERRKPRKLRYNWQSRKDRDGNAW